MVNPAGRPNISNEVLDEKGRFTSVWYRFMEQMWIRSGGSTDDITDLRAAIELVELIPITENILPDDLTPPLIEREAQDDLSPRFEADQTALKESDIGTTVQAFSGNLDTYAANSLTAVELGELQNINAVTITNAQWAFLGNFDQDLTTTSEVNFGIVRATEELEVNDTGNAKVVLNGGAASEPFVQWEQLGVFKAFIQWKDAASNFDIFSTGGVEIYAGSVVALAFDASQNANFTANLTVDSGNEVFLNLPTVATGTSGSLWDDSGTVKVVP